MTTILVLLFALPAGAGLLGLLLGRRVAAPLAVLGSLAALVFAVILALEVDPASRQSAVELRETWIPALGIDFHLAVDGLNAALLVMATFVWFLGTVWSLRDRELASPSYLFMLALAESAVVGAFLAQDLMLFVLCFDLMLLPFVLITARAAGDGVLALAPVLQLLVYTLVGSLLMFAAAVALGILAADSQGAPVTFDLATLATTTLDPATQKWIYAALLAAFLIKMPVAPLHGWVRGAYLAMPLPALAIFAAALSKVAAYGFLKIALPILPDAVVSWRILLVVLALVAILYGSLVALSSREPRIILAYSSIAQLGFILLGISSLDPAGAQGAIMQSITHALVVVPAVILITMIFERAGKIESLEQLGGLARRAPVLSILFLLVALCWLAMPGTGNFIAEYLVLLGQWRVAPWATIIASIGIALAAVYVLRLFIGTMQNARGPAVPTLEPGAAPKLEVRRFDGSVLALGIVALAVLSLVPQLALRQSETAARSAVETPRALYESERRGERPFGEVQSVADEPRPAITEVPSPGEPVPGEAETDPAAPETGAEAPQPGGDVR